MKGAIEEYRHFPIRFAKQTGGKAGTGRNKTTTIQVVSEQNDGSVVIEKSVRLNVGDRPSFVQAMVKARAWIDKQYATGKA